MGVLRIIDRLLALSYLVFFLVYQFIDYQASLEFVKYLFFVGLFINTSLLIIRKVRGRKT